MACQHLECSCAVLASVSHKGCTRQSNMWDSHIWDDVVGWSWKRENLVGKGKFCTSSSRTRNLFQGGKQLIFWHHCGRGVRFLAPLWPSSLCYLQIKAWWQGKRANRGLTNLENSKLTPDCHSGILLSSQWVNTGERKGMKMRRTICEVWVVRVFLKRWALAHTFHFGGLPWEVQPQDKEAVGLWWQWKMFPQLRTWWLQGKLQLFGPMLWQQNIHVVKAGWHARGRWLWYCWISEETFGPLFILTLSTNCW